MITKNIKLKNNISMILLSIITIGLCACSSIKNTDTSQEEISYLDTLVDGTIYIRHADETCENVYLGDSTFEERKIANGVSTDRISWFKEDWNNIPTLYKGDNLIMYTESIFEENFIFERFCDIGYTIGLRVPGITKTGRFQLKTDVQELLTYPDGDTDEINDLPNETVILESLGGQKLRAEKANEKNYYRPINFCTVSNEYDISKLLSTYGTILNLSQNESYHAEVYNGTVLSEYIFKADVRVLGCMELIENNNYEFESGKIIVIEIPEWFNSGYYMINGQGLFRYVNAETIDEIEDFNIPNVPPEDKKMDFFSINKDNMSSSNVITEGNGNEIVNDGTIKEYIYTYNKYNEETQDYDSEKTIIQSYNNECKIELLESGNYIIHIGFIGANNESLTNTMIAMITPDEKYYELDLSENGFFTKAIEAAPEGVYQFIFYNSNDYIPEIVIQEALPQENWQQ